MEFGNTKSGMIVFVRKILNQLKSKGMKCKSLQCDNAGEHSGLKELCIEFGVELEFTPPYSPQYNVWWCWVGDSIGDDRVVRQ